ncbi:right-handed parallel beta-helix repeat-containing protein [Mucilaginibacter frigoritolerans]|nr:right-handed parallel beta-helix repeat-containing protein [Mucilaginibacter frigoritolerans]
MRNWHHILLIVVINFWCIFSHANATIKISEKIIYIKQIGIIRPKSIAKTHTPEEFGAIGDGVHDDTEALKKALNATGDITFKKGRVYKITNTVIVKSVKKIIDLNNSTINRDPSKIGFSFENCNTIVFKNGKILCSAKPIAGAGSENCINYVQCKNITTTKLIIDGSNEMGIAHIACIGVIASYNNIKNCYRDGIHEIYCANVQVFENTLSNIKDDALACHDYGTDGQKLFIRKNGYTQASNIKIYNNVINNAYQGISSISCKNIEITNNTISSTVGAGIAIFNTQAINIGGTARVNGAIIQNNKINNSCGSQKIMGIMYDNNGQNSTGRGAIFVGTLGTNGQLNDATILSNVSVVNNKVNNCGVNGLWFTNTVNAIISDNNFTNCCNETSSFSGTVCAIYNITNGEINNNITVDNRTVKKHYFGFDLQNVTGNVSNLIDKGSKAGYHIVNTPAFRPITN